MTDIPIGYRQVKCDEVYTNDERIVILGTPDDLAEDNPKAHNCDDMGCGSVGPHVLFNLSTHPEARAETAEAKNTELEELFSLQRTRTIEVDRLWQQAHDEPNLFPDLGELLGWLMESRDAVITALATANTQAKNIQAELTLLRADILGLMAVRDRALAEAVGLRYALVRAEQTWRNLMYMTSGALADSSYTIAGNELENMKLALAASPLAALAADVLEKASYYAWVRQLPPGTDDQGRRLSYAGEELVAAWNALRRAEESKT